MRKRHLPEPDIVAKPADWAVIFISDTFVVSFKSSMFSSRQEEMASS